MHLRTILALLLLVGALALVWWRRAEPTLPTTGRPLFPGVETDRVVALRVESLERGTIVKLERDEAGRWFLTDPLAYPANAGLVDAALQVVRRNEAIEVPGADAEALGLDPPRGILEVTERIGRTGEEERRTRVELGALDVDSRLVFARSNGAVVSTRRNLDNLFDRSPDDWRSRSAVDLRPEDAVALRRSGRLRFDAAFPPAAARDAEDDLTLAAEMGASAVDWMASEPVRVALDPQAVGLLARGFAYLDVLAFHDDSLDDLSSYGLDDPLMRFELTTVDGRSEALLFGIRPEERASLGTSPDLDSVLWLCMREGGRFVWEVGSRDVRLLASPLGNLLDYRLAHGRREDYRRVRLEGAAGVVLLEREGSGWTVSDGAGAARPADAGRVEDVLLAIESAELLEWLPGQELGARSGTWEVEGADGTIQGGELGAPFAIEDGERSARGVCLRRRGEEAVFLAPEDVSALLELRAGELRSLLVHAVDERTLAALEVSGPGGAPVRWERDSTGRWERADRPGVEATELWDLLDPLLNLRATRWLEAPAAAELTGTVDVHLVRTGGEALQFRLGLAGGEEVCEEGDSYAAVDPGLRAGLLSLLAP